ncbi:MAG: nucleotidyl transferase AbiEii/AbiGii toxin family protein [Elusimicrobiota bacterium]
MELLSQIQKKILEIFTTIPEQNNFYLTGGTALSVFYLKHRRSNDLDFFTKLEDIITPFSYHLEEKLKNEKMIVQKHRMISSFLEYFLEKESETLIIHLAQDSPLRFEEPKIFKEFPKLNVDSLIDIASNKLLALFGRATLRDFIDIFFLIKKGEFTPEKLMNDAKIKDPGFDLYWLGITLERINVFKENSPEMSFLLEPLNFMELQNFFNNWRKNITRQIIS